MKNNHESFIIFSKVYDKQSIILLSNSHAKIDENIYEFSIIYHHTEGKLPNSEYGIKLHLINPDGIALNPFQMKIRGNDLKNQYINLENYMIFHYKVDLKELYDDKGLWHYFFTLKKDSPEDQLIFIPEIGYLLGPDLTTHKSAYFESYYVYSKINKPYISSGFKKYNFRFIVSVENNKDLEKIYMCLIPAKKTNETGVSNTIGIKKFPMVLHNSYPNNYEGPVNFQCNVNFEVLGYKNSELGWFHHYYEGVFQDGTKSYLYQDKIFYDLAEECGIDNCNNYIWVDIKKPFVVSQQPQLIDYIFEESKNFIFSQNYFSLDISEPLNKEIKTKYEIKSDSIIEFEVLFSDPSGNKPMEGFPKLIFRSMDYDKELEITMVENNIISSFSQHYGEIFRSYVCRVKCLKLFEGTWNFYFEAKDSEGNDMRNLLGEEKFVLI